MMKNIFIDTNILIDFLADRRPFSLDAAKLFDFAINEKITVHVSAISYNNIYYILRKSLSDNSAIRLLEELQEMTVIADVTGKIIRRSLKAGFKDYEDAIQYFCALSIPGIDCIVTRNSKDFKKSALAIMTPAEAIIALAGNL
ncbi:MAG TPA: PIN domain-containing protein [Mucilaginibacter sp.]|nr:PIN domain-containing protein [Mucilaginibacter sp.]